MRIFRLVSLCLFIVNYSLVFCVVHANPYIYFPYIYSYAHTKKLLEAVVYTSPVERRTLYCNANFDEKRQIALPKGFTTQKFRERATRLEWEHVVPVENFGKTFRVWHEGDALCVDKNGDKYKGRKCADKVSKEFKQMQADMYNLYPSIGAVNASRRNYNFAMLPNAASDFGTCLVKIDSRNDARENSPKVEPPEHARGKIARTYLYMEYAYPRYKMSKKQRTLMHTWNTKYAVTYDECQRTKRIESVQGNENIIVKKQCLEQDLW